MLKKSSPYLAILAILICSICGTGTCNDGDEGVWGSSTVVKREQRKTLVSTEYGEITAVRIGDYVHGSNLVHFFTLEPNSLFLPVILHQDMVFYVHTGSGRLSWTEEDDLRRTDLRRGDVYRLEQGSIFFIQGNLETETERQKLRIHAFFARSDNDLREPDTGPYSSIRDMVTSFDRNVLQAAFKVPEQVIDELLNATKQPAFIHGVATTERKGQFIKSVLDSRSYNVFELNKKKKSEKAKLFNLFKEDKDFKNCNGWSTTVTRKKLSALSGTNIGVFMVNLTIGSMMGPHWNPMATEIATVLQGRGIVRVVCADVLNETPCKNMRFLVEEGDVFAVPRFHPMAQMSFNNDTFVFMGFSTSTKRNHPQFLAGQASVLRTLDRDVLARAFNVANTTLDQILASQRESVILGCTSCAEEELRVMQEEVEREREEAREREKEESRRREEDRRKEEEEARKREEEAARRQEEERRKREEEEEEEATKRQEEEERKRQEEEEKKRREEEEEAARREEEQRQRQQQEEAEARRQEEERQRREAEEAARREEEEEQRQKQQEEGAEGRRQEEERQKREAEEAAKREEEQRQRQQEETEARREEEEAQRREAEEAARRWEKGRREEQERQRREEEERGGGEEHGGGRREEEQQGGRSEEEQAAEQERRMEEEARREAEERERERGGEGGEEAA